MSINNHMSYYKVVYKVDSYDTPHSRFYHAENTDTARDMFTETCETTLQGSCVDVLKIVQIQEQDDDLHECGCGDPGCQK